MTNFLSFSFLLLVLFLILLSPQNGRGGTRKNLTAMEFSIGLAFNSRLFNGNHNTRIDSGPV